MNSEDRHIDEIFRDAIDRARGPRSAAVWDKLQLQLNRKRQWPRRRKYTASKRMLLCSACLLFCLFIADSKPIHTATGRAAPALNQSAIHPRPAVVKNNALKPSRYQLASANEISAVSGEAGTGGFSFRHAALPSLLPGYFIGLRLRFPPPNGSASIIRPAETAKPGHPFKPYWSMTGFVLREWTQYSLKDGVPDNASPGLDEKSEIENREDQRPSFSASLLATRLVTKHWGLQAGISYSNTAILIEPQTLYAGREPTGQVGYKFNSSSGYAYLNPGFSASPAVGDSLSTSITRHHLEYISFPLLLQYRFEKNRWSISPAAGLSANILTAAKIRTDIIDAQNTETIKIAKLEGARPFYLGLTAVADIRYRLDGRWSLSLLAAFRYALTPVTKNNVVETYPYSLGIGTGISYRF